jgi:hypothetical protein
MLALLQNNEDLDASQVMNLLTWIPEYGWVVLERGVV